MTFVDAKALAEAENKQIMLAYARDPVLAARQLCPHWFSRPMQWFHRGMLAILLRKTDFLLNFSVPGSPEIWSDGARHWTKKDLAKIVKHFTYAIRPNDPKSPRAPIFRVRYGEDGRTPVSIDMVLGQHVCIIIPRGFSKTTIINFANLYKAVFQLTKFTVYVSEAATHAEAQLATVQRELATNERIIAIFGQQKPDRADEESWGAKSCETLHGVKFAAKGRGAQIRGLNMFSDRPDCIVLDDVEDKESVATDTQREKASDWYASDVEQALSRDNDNACIYAIGTLLHPKALLPTLCKRQDYTSVVFGAAVPTGEMRDTGKRDAQGKHIFEPVMEPLWDDKAGLSLKALEVKKQAMAAMGKLYSFYLEFMSSVRDDTKLKFKAEYIRYQTCRPEDFVARSIHIDPAIAPMRPNDPPDYVAIAVVGIKANGHKHVCDLHLEQGMPMSAQAEKYFDMKIRWDCTHHSSESTAYQAALAQVIRELMFIKAKTMGTKAYFQILDTWPKGRKIERVEGILQPIMAAGYLTFQQIWPELEVQLLDWPNEKLDGPDAIAGAIANLEPYAPLSIEDPEILERQYGEPTEFEAPCAMGSGKVP